MNSSRRGPIHTSRGKRPLDRERVAFRDASLIIIATEGEKTEKQYFDMFHSSRVQVEVLPTEEGYSSPQAVLERLDTYRSEYELGDNDQLWYMGDIDRWPEGTLSQVVQLCKQKGYRTAISNPCFELWLLLHHADVDPGRSYLPDEVKDLLREQIGGYNPSKLNCDKFRDCVEDAVRRAATFRADPARRWPEPVGTDVFLVVREILAKTGES